MLSLKAKLRIMIFHPFSRDVAILQAGTIFNTVISFLSSLIFARLLGPEGYGYYALVFAFAGLINIFQEFGIGQGTINLLARAFARNDADEARKIFSAFTKISIWAALSSGLLGIIFSPLLAKIFYQDVYLGKLAAVVVAATALTYFYPVATIALQVIRKIKLLAVLESLHKFFMSGLPVVLLWGGMGVLGIVAGHFAAVLVLSLAGFMVYQRFARERMFLPKFQEFLGAAFEKGYLKNFFLFGFEIAASKNLIKLAQTIPILLVGYFLTTDSALGFYKIALGYVSLPIVLLGPVSRLLNVQFPKTETLGEGRLLRRFWQVTFLSAVLTGVMILPLILLGPFLIRLFYGINYEPAIKMIYPLALYPVFMSLGVGLGPLFRTLNRMKVAILIQIISLILLIPGTYYLIGAYAIKGLIAVVLIFSLLPTLMSLAYFYRPKNGGNSF